MVTFYIQLTGLYLPIPRIKTIRQDINVCITFFLKESRIGYTRTTAIFIEQNWFVFAQGCKTQLQLSRRNVTELLKYAGMKLSWLSQVNQLPLTNQLFKSSIVHKFSSFTDAEIIKCHPSKYSLK